MNFNHGTINYYWFGFIISAEFLCKEEMGKMFSILGILAINSEIKNMACAIHCV